VTQVRTIIVWSHLVGKFDRRLGFIDAVNLHDRLNRQQRVQICRHVGIPARNENFKLISACPVKVDPVRSHNDHLTTLYPSVEHDRVRLLKLIDHLADHDASCVRACKRHFESKDLVDLCVLSIDHHADLVNVLVDPGQLESKRGMGKQIRLKQHTPSRTLEHLLEGEHDCIRRLLHGRLLDFIFEHRELSIG